MRWRSVEDGETDGGPGDDEPERFVRARGEISEIVFRQIAVPNHRRAVRKDGEAVLKGQPAGRQGERRSGNSVIGASPSCRRNRSLGRGAPAVAFATTD